MSLATGDKLGDCEIISSLGAGGMGEVYRAKDTKLNKQPRATNPTMSMRARRLLRLAGENVAKRIRTRRELLGLA